MHCGLVSPESIATLLHMLKIQNLALSLFVFTWCSINATAATHCSRHQDCAKDEYCYFEMKNPSCRRKNYDPQYALMFIAKTTGDAKADHTLCALFVTPAKHKDKKSESWLEVSKYVGRREVSRRKTEITPEYDLAEVHKQFLDASDLDWQETKNAKPTDPTVNILVGDYSHYFSVLDDAASRWENKSKGGEYLIKLSDAHCP
jgi:hypothetical protein